MEVYLQCIHPMQLLVFVGMLTLFAVPDCATGTMNERASCSQTIFKITIESRRKSAQHRQPLPHPQCASLQITVYCTMAFCRNMGIDGARKNFQPC